jgi:ATP-dependent Clp protease ATP-binding subunit ClpC
MSEKWSGQGISSAASKVHVTQDLSSPLPSGTKQVVFTAITKRGQKVMEWAERESKNFGLDDIASTAILMSILSEDRGASLDILREMGVDLDAAFKALHDALKSESAKGKRTEPVNARILLTRAQEKAAAFDDKVVEPEHIMLALIDSGQSLAMEILLRLGVNVRELKARLLYYLECQRMERDMSRSTTPIFQQMTPLEQAIEKDEESGTLLKFFGRDLVQEARDRRLDVAAGRENLIQRMMRILCRSRRNNPLLVGESGVGKSYMVEALAHRIAEGDVPEQLRDVRISELDAIALVDGASLRGELEKRIKNLVKEMASSPSGFIIFIPYVHTMMGEEARNSGVSLTPILQPILENPKIWCIATTTFKYYDNLIASDEYLSSFFHNIQVEELSPEGTLQLLGVLRPHYERFHNVKINDDALEAAVTLSDRYLTELNLPDKAIDLVDEAATHVAMARTGTGVSDVGDESVAEVVTMATGIPVKRLLKEEAERLLHMEDEMSKRIIGQRKALRVVSETIRRSRAGLADQRKPIGSFLFMGPTGVGKTEVARSLADFLFGGEKSMVRLDMSEFSEKHSVAKLIGSPPGYIGYEEGGLLTSAVDQKPYSVVLLDEIEKAHPAVFNLLLQLLDEGRLTDSHGKTVNFRNTIIIMTSNIASDIIAELAAADAAEGEGLNLEAENLLMDKVKENFSMEFINRIDEIVIFDPLSLAEIESIVDLKLATIAKLLEKKAMRLHLDQSAKGLLAQHGYSSEFGARFLQRAIQKELTNPLSDFLLRGDMGSGDTVVVEAVGDELVFKVTKNDSDEGESGNPPAEDR